MEFPLSCTYPIGIAILYNFMRPFCSIWPTLCIIYVTIDQVDKKLKATVNEFDGKVTLWPENKNDCKEVDIHSNQQWHWDG